VEDDYWKDRSELDYYRVACNYVKQYLCFGTVLDVGGAVGLGCTYLSRLPTFERISVELSGGDCSLDGVNVSRVKATILDVVENVPRRGTNTAYLVSLPGESNVAHKVSFVLSVVPRINTGDSRIGVTQYVEKHPTCGTSLPAAYFKGVLGLSIPTLKQGTPNLSVRCYPIVSKLKLGLLVVVRKLSFGWGIYS